MLIPTPGTRAQGFATRSSSAELRGAAHLAGHVRYVGVVDVHEAGRFDDRACLTGFSIGQPDTVRILRPVAGEAGLAPHGPGSNVLRQLNDPGELARAPVRVDDVR